MELLLSSVRAAEGKVEAAALDPAAGVADYVQLEKDLAELQVRLCTARHYEGLKKQCERSMTELRTRIDKEAKKAARAGLQPLEKGKGAAARKKKRAAAAAWRRDNVAKWEAALRKAAAVNVMATEAFEAALN